MGAASDASSSELFWADRTKSPRREMVLLMRCSREWGSSHFLKGRHAATLAQKDNSLQIAYQAEKWKLTGWGFNARMMCVMFC